MFARINVNTAEEIKHILLADAVLIVAFSLTLSGGIISLAGNTGSASSFISNFIVFIPIAALAVSLSFILHELMHKFVAQHYGAIAGFRSSLNGLLITLLTGAMGFLLGIPGATMIYAHSFTKKQNGVVSLAGPLTNLAVFSIFAALFLVVQAPGSYLGIALSVTTFISIWLAFFNMLPIFPLDGSKVFAWNKPIYFVTLTAIMLLLIFARPIFPIPITISDIVFVVIIAIAISMLTRHLI